MRKVLVGLGAIVDGIAALRTHKGSAHGHAISSKSMRGIYRSTAGNARARRVSRLKIALLILLLLSVQVQSTTIARDSHGRIRRSPAVRREFLREHPCPSTGLTRGRCPHWVVDHRVPLECGGPDSPSNMQWQTVTDARIKGRTERLCRLPRLDLHSVRVRWIA